MVGIGAFWVFMRIRLNIELYSPIKPTKVGFIFIRPNSLSQPKILQLSITWHMQSSKLGRRRNYVSSRSFKSRAWVNTVSSLVDRRLWFKLKRSVHVLLIIKSGRWLLIFLPSCREILANDASTSVLLADSCRIVSLKFRGKVHLVISLKKTPIWVMDSSSFKGSHESKCNFKWPSMQRWQCILKTSINK